MLGALYGMTRLAFHGRARRDRGGTVESHSSCRAVGGIAPPSGLYRRAIDAFPEVVAPIFRQRGSGERPFQQSAIVFLFREQNVDFGDGDRLGFAAQEFKWVS